MKKLFTYFIIGFILFSCGSDKKGNMVITGKIDGFKKGTFYLQKFKDTLLVTVDSLYLNGKNEFKLVDNVESPEIYLLALDKLTDKILFFGEPGEIAISTKLSKFSTSAKVEGSKNQELLDEYNNMIQQFNGKQLDLFKQKFDAQKENNTDLVNEIEKEQNSLLKRRYQYATNFAVNNADFEVAPYIALTDLYNANVVLLDTINNSLSNKIKTSKYGVKLQDFITKIKDSEK